MRRSVIDIGFHQCFGTHMDEQQNEKQQIEYHLNAARGERERERTRVFD